MIVKKLALLVVLLFCQNCFAENRIVDGSNADENTHPYMVSLFPSYSMPSNSEKSHFCGGSLIAPDLVLTAAHCLENFIKNPEEISVANGSIDLRNPNLKISRAKNILLHPSYIRVGANYTDDLGLIKLSQSLSAANIEVMDPVTDRTIVGGTPINIMGWGLAGNDSENLELPRILQEASHSLVDQNICEQELTVAPYDRSIMYCVGNPLNQNSPTPCYGDSGSPMTTKVGNKEKIIGIASWGDRPCYYQEYLAYTRAATYYDWIYANHEYPLFVRKNPQVSADKFTGSGQIPIGAKLRCTGAEFNEPPVDSYIIWNIQKKDSLNQINLPVEQEFIVNNVHSKSLISCQIVGMNSQGTLVLSSRNKLSVKRKRRVFRDLQAATIKLMPSERKEYSVRFPTIVSDQGKNSGVADIVASYQLVGKYCFSSNNCIDRENSGFAIVKRPNIKKELWYIDIPNVLKSPKIKLEIIAIDNAGNRKRVSASYK